MSIKNQKLHICTLWITLWIKASVKFWLFSFCRKPANNLWDVHKILWITVDNLLALELMWISLLVIHKVIPLKNTFGY
ncbi:MAG: hypothetical protein EBS36_02840 [Actinobacteria bacterium]|nr:hypothetical protein [Actinomycetota bacterium]NBY15960.1 hypothetical protein [Actinomycetota bacterium]